MLNSHKLTGCKSSLAVEVVVDTLKVIFVPKND